MLLRTILFVVLFIIEGQCRPFLTNLLPIPSGGTSTTQSSVISDYHNQHHTGSSGTGALLAGILAGDDGRNGSIFPELFTNFLNIAREYVSTTLTNLIQSGINPQTPREMPMSTSTATTTTPTTSSTTERHYEVDEDEEEPLPAVEALTGMDPRFLSVIQRIQPRIGTFSASENNIESGLPVGNERKLNEDTTEILDAFFDLDNDEIFYNGTGSKSIQHPRLLALIRSSLAKYRSQAEMGLLQNLTAQERNRIRVLYMVRPIFGVLRRKAENTKIREKLKVMEMMLDEIQRESIIQRAKRRSKRSIQVEERDHIGNSVEDDGFDEFEDSLEKAADDILTGKAEIEDPFGLLFILELFGTVAGLAFGAFNQISKFIREG